MSLDEPLPGGIKGPDIAARVADRIKVHRGHHLCRRALLYGPDRLYAMSTNEQAVRSDRECNKGVRAAERVFDRPVRGHKGILGTAYVEDIPHQVVYSD